MFSFPTLKKQKSDEFNDQSIGSTETKYIELNTKTQIFKLACERIELLRTEITLRRHRPSKVF